MTATQLVRVRDLAASGKARRIRVMARLSLAEMARDLGVSDVTLSRWERGLCRPRGDAAVAYGALLDQLLERTTP